MVKSGSHVTPLATPAAAHDKSLDLPEVCQKIEYNSFILCANDIQSVVSAHHARCDVIDVTDLAI